MAMLETLTCLLLVLCGISCPVTAQRREAQNLRPNPLPKYGISQTAAVATATDMMIALGNTAVTEILVTQDIVGIDLRRLLFYLTRDVTITKDPTSTRYPLLQFLDINGVDGDSRVDQKPSGVALVNSTLTLSFLRLMGMNRIARERPTFLLPNSTGHITYNYCVLYREACLAPSDLLKQAVKPDGSLGTATQPAVQQESNYCVPGLGRDYCYSTAIMYHMLALYMLRGPNAPVAAPVGNAMLTYRNTVMVCEVFVSEQCASQPLGPQQDACVALAKASIKPPPAPVPPSMIEETIVEEAKVNLVAILVPACVGSAAVLALVAYLTYRFKRYQRPSAEDIAAGKYDTKPGPLHAQLATMVSCNDSDSIHGVAYATCLAAKGDQRSFKLIQQDGCVTLVPNISTDHSGNGGGMGSAGRPATASATPQPVAGSKGSPVGTLVSIAMMTSSQPHAGLGIQAAAPLFCGGATATSVAAGNDDVSMSTIQLHVQLGAGSYGQVYRGIWRHQTVAVKVILHAKQNTERIRHEADLMMRLEHANVVRALHYEVLDAMSMLHGMSAPSLMPGSSALSLKLPDGGHSSSQEPSSLESTGGAGGRAGGPHAAGHSAQTWVVMEYCNAGSLASYIHSPGGQGHHSQAVFLGDMRSILSLACDMARGMVYLHLQRVCHGDLKCENVLLCTYTEEGSNRTSICAKIADFGLSRVIAENNTHIPTATIGTVTHMPPELLQDGVLRQSGDVYAFGIMLWQLVTRQQPYSDMRMQQVVVRVVNDNLRPEFPAHIPERYTELAQACWARDPALRPTFDEVLLRLSELLSKADVLQAQYDRALAQSAASSSCDGRVSASDIPEGQQAGPPNPFAAALYVAGMAALSL